jgi:hypothetical protein
MYGGQESPRRAYDSQSTLLGCIEAWRTAWRNEGQCIQVIFGFNTPFHKLDAEPKMVGTCYCSHSVRGNFR